MSVRHIGLVLDHYPGPTHLKLLLVVLADHADGDTGECWPSLRILARRTCLEERTVQRHLRRLEAEGWICVARDGGTITDPTTGLFAKAANVYRIIADRLTAEPCLRTAESFRPAADMRFLVTVNPVDNSPSVIHTPDTHVTGTPDTHVTGTPDTHVTLTVIKNRHRETSFMAPVDNSRDRAVADAHAARSACASLRRHWADQDRGEKRA